jgi:hypothetical protein
LSDTLTHVTSAPQSGIATNFLQSPPLTDPALLFEDVFSNEYVHQIVEGYLGPNIQLSFITANTALAGTRQRQPVHKDAPVGRLSPLHLMDNTLTHSDVTVGASNGTLHAQHQLPSLWFVSSPSSPTGGMTPDFLRADFTPESVTLLAGFP